MSPQFPHRNYMIIYADTVDIIDYPPQFEHDPLSQVFYQLIYRPTVWSASSPYIQDLDVIIPVIPNGCMYQCVSGGISSVLTPTLSTVSDHVSLDGSVKWLTRPLTSLLGYGDTIIASTWSGSEGVTLTSSIVVNDGTVSMVKVTGVDATRPYFTLTNSVTIRRSSGIEESIERTLRIRIRDCDRRGG